MFCEKNDCYRNICDRIYYIIAINSCDVSYLSKNVILFTFIGTNFYYPLQIDDVQCDVHVMIFTLKIPLINITTINYNIIHNS